MKRLLSYIGVIITSCTLFSQGGSSLYLPVVKNGKWFIFHNNEYLSLPLTYQYVTPFDNKGTAQFFEGKNYGIINQEGVEIYKTLTNEINQIGNGIFSKTNLNGFSIFNPYTSDTIFCTWYEKIDENWMVYKDSDNQKIIFNLNWKEGTRLNDEAEVKGIFKGFLLIKYQDFKMHLYDDKGILIDSSKANYLMDENQFYFKGEKVHFYINSDINLNFDKTIKDVIIGEKSIKIKSVNNLKLIDKFTNRKIIEYPCDNIMPEGENYKITIKLKNGLIDKKGKILIPVKYEYITPNSKGYLLTENGLQGFMDNQFRLRIPCEFLYIQFRKDFIYTCNYLSKRGLIHPTTYEIILPALFYTIKIDRNIVKAYNETKMALLELDENKKVKNKMFVNNVIYVPQNENIKNDIKIDSRLFSIGWYIDSLNSDWEKGKLKWGIRYDKDSVFMKPRFIKPVYLENASFTLVQNNSVKVSYFSNLQPKWNRKVVDEYPSFNLIDFQTGKKMNQEPIISVDTTDFVSRNYTRFFQADKMGFITLENQIIYVKYIDVEDDEIVRFCHSNEMDTVNENNTQKIIFRNYNLNSPKSDYRYVGAFQFKNAKWNFLNKNGDSLFTIPFDFAYKFHKNTAIVQRNKSWGVVNEDSTIIPIKFSKIERLKEFNDTLFMVTLSQKGKVYLDSNMNRLDFENAEFHQMKNGNLRFELKNNYKIFNEENEATFESERSVKFKNYGMLITRSKKLFDIYNADGKLMYSSVLSPLEILTPSTFLTIKDSKYGVIDFIGDTILPFTFKSIIRKGDYIIANQGDEVQLFDSTFKIIQLFKNVEVFVDEVNDLYLVRKGETNIIYNAKHIKLNKWKCENDIKTFNSGKIIDSKGLVYQSNGEQLKLDIKVNKIHYFETDLTVLEDFQGRFYIYDKEGKLLIDSLQKNKRLKYHGDYTFSTLDKGKVQIYDLNNPDNNLKVDAVSGNWENGFLTIKVNRRSFFIDRNFLNSFQNDYKNAYDFKENRGVIQTEMGWTLIDNKGNYLSLPSYSEIIPIHDNLFETNKKNLFGIYDSHGIEIVSPIYEKITIINNSFFQCIKNGELFYFTKRGERIL